MYDVRNVYSKCAWDSWDSGREVGKHCCLDDTASDQSIEFNPIGTFDDLAERVSFLQLMNKRHVLYFRGLNRKYRDDLPSIFRLSESADRSAELRRRLDVLRRQAAVWRKFLGHKVHPRQRTLDHYPETIWAVQQHYKDALDKLGVEGARTPYLDVTQSVRVAAIFATARSKQDASALKRQPALVKVVALPQTTGSITYSADEQLQLLRLSAVCPPGARRPLVQEGHLVARFPLPSDDDLCDWLLNDRLKLERLMSLRRRTVAIIPIATDRDGGFSRFWGEAGTPAAELLRCPWFEKNGKKLGRLLAAA